MKEILVQIGPTFVGGTSRQLLFLDFLYWTNKNFFVTGLVSPLFLPRLGLVMPPMVFCFSPLFIIGLWREVGGLL